MVQVRNEVINSNESNHVFKNIDVWSVPHFYDYIFNGKIIEVFLTASHIAIFYPK
jgi:hypothetical protein